jgi:AcrR family transcriptional regulator
MQDAGSVTCSRSPGKRTRGRRGREYVRQVTAGLRQSTKERIYESAIRLFYERGYHATTMRDISAMAGIKPPSIYNHYPSKQEILHQIAEGIMADLLRGAREAISHCPDPAAELRAFIAWHVTFHAHRRFEAKIADDQLHVLEPRRKRNVLAIRDAYEDLLKDILARGQVSCHWRVADISVITFAIATMCTAVDTWYRDHSRLSAEKIARIYADFILASLESGREA